MMTKEQGEALIKYIDTAIAAAEMRAYASRGTVGVSIEASNAMEDRRSMALSRVRELLP